MVIAHSGPSISRAPRRALLPIFGAICALIAACPEPEPPAAPAAPAPPVAAAPEPTLTFGVTPYMSADELRIAFRPLLDYLESKITRKVELYVGESYADLVAKLKAGEVDAAILSPYAYVLAKRAAPDLELVCTAVINGKSAYQGLLLTMTESGLKTLNDLKGKTICYVGKESASGYVFPRAAMEKAGIDPDEHFGRAILTGSHSKAIRGLIDGDCDAATVYEDVVDKAFDDYAIGRAQLHTVLSTGKIPGNAFVLRHGLPSVTKRRLASAMIALGPEVARELHLTSRYALNGGCLAASDADYEPVRQVKRYLGEAEPADGASAH